MQLFIHPEDSPLGCSLLVWWAKALISSGKVARVYTYWEHYFYELKIFYFFDILEDSFIKFSLLDDL